MLSIWTFPALSSRQGPTKDVSEIDVEQPPRRRQHQVVQVAVPYPQDVGHDTVPCTRLTHVGSGMMLSRVSRRWWTATHRRQRMSVCSEPGKTHQSVSCLTSTKPGQGIGQPLQPTMCQRAGALQLPQAQKAGVKPGAAMSERQASPAQLRTKASNTWGETPNGPAAAEAALCQASPLPAAANTGHYRDSWHGAPCSPLAHVGLLCTFASLNAPFVPGSTASQTGQGQCRHGAAPGHGWHSQQTSSQARAPWELSWHAAYMQLQCRTHPAAAEACLPDQESAGRSTSGWSPETPASPRRWRCWA